MQNLKSVCVTMVAIVLWTASVSAQTNIYNSFGPNNSYSTATVWAVTGASTTGGYRGQAEVFTPGAPGFLSFVNLAVFHISGSRLSNFYIAQDSGAGVPGTILETFSNVTVNNGLLSLTSVQHPLLEAGISYWLCFEPAAADASNGWYYNNQGYNFGFAFERAHWSWSYISSPAPASGVFRIAVTPVPEPATLGLGILGGISLTLVARSKTRS